MGGYWGCFVLGLKECVAYPSETLAGIVNTLLAIVASTAVWSAIYQAEVVREISQTSLVTYITLMFVLRAAFEMDDFFVERRVRKGTIGLDLIRPLRFRLFLFSYMAGGAAFRCLVQLTPAMLLVMVWTGIRPPVSGTALALALTSAAVGYLVLFNLNFLVWVSSFWLHATWSLVTIKDALILVLSGVAFPLWFMPDAMRSVVELTPFVAIMHTPVAIYLGKLGGGDAFGAILLQTGWAVALHLLGRLAYARGVRRIVVQGG